MPCLVILEGGFGAYFGLSELFELFTGSHRRVAFYRVLKPSFDI